MVVELSRETQLANQLKSSADCASEETNIGYFRCWLLPMTSLSDYPLLCIDDVLSSFQDGTEVQLRRFACFLWDELDINFKEGKLYRERFNFFCLVDRFEDMGTLVRSAKSNCPVLVALWVIFLRVIHRNGELATSMRKYKDQAAFLAEYNDMFPNVSEREMNFLFQIANWMHIMLGMVVAKKSKCLAMRVIPKLIEGHGMNYVLGTGQKKGTNRRALIFEHESGLSPSRKKKSVMNWSVDENKRRRAVTQPLNTTTDILEEQGQLYHAVGLEEVVECNDLADLLLQTATSYSFSNADVKLATFEPLHSIDTLSGISSFITQNEELPALEKWDLILKTTLLPASLPARNDFIECLNKKVLLVLTTPEAALVEVIDTDEEAAFFNRSCTLTCFESLSDKTQSTNNSEEHMSFAA